MVPVWQDAEDILQETKVRLWDQFARFTPGTNFGAWASTVARFMVLEYRERASRQKLYFSGDLKISGDVMASQKLKFLSKLDPQLVVNAIAHSRAGQAVRLGYQMTSDGLVVFEVNDDGAGMEPGQLVPSSALGAYQ